MTDKKCSERIDDHYESRMEDLKALWAGYCQEECPDCDGTGYSNEIQNTTEDGDIEYKECPKCNGTGELEEETEIGNIHEYGLSFDYCYPTKEGAGYFRYQISWGGPGDEFRIYANQYKRGWDIYKIEYWFLDWFDGAKKILVGDDYKWMKDFVQSYFGETESMTYEFEKAMENYEPEDDEEEMEDDDE